MTDGTVSTPARPPGPQADPGRVVDYYKYTLALAVATFAYMPATFLPASGPVWWLVMASATLALVSAVMGMALFGAYARILGGQEHAPWLPKATQHLGAAHVATLILALVIAALPFWARFAAAGPPAQIDCRLSLEAVILPDATPVALTVPCEVR